MRWCCAVRSARARFLVRAGIFGERSLPETWKRTVCVFSGHQSRNYYQKQAAYSCGFCRIGVYYNNVKERGKHRHLSGGVVSGKGAHAVMEASQSIQLKTEQKLVISQRLQQQLAILHMTLQEVAALANEQLQSNPMLEVAEGAEAADSPFSDLSLDALEGTLARSESFDDGALPVSSGATFYRVGQSGEAPADFLRYTYKPESLEDYLAFQLADYPLSEAQKQICRHLIAMLDEHGFFREPLADAAQLLGTDEFELTQMLYVIQSLDPPGIGARDLQECLICSWRLETASMVTRCAL